MKKISKLFIPLYNRLYTGEYWNGLYKLGGNSGKGSKGCLLDYKILFINNFIKYNNIRSVFDYGCGDCSVGNKLIVSNYKGTDKSNYIIRTLKDKYHNDIFFYYDERYNIKYKYDLCISLDVLYHIIDYNEYVNYLYYLFSVSKRYVLIYAVDTNRNNNEMRYIKYRKFTEFIKNNIKDFKLKKLLYTNQSIHQHSCSTLRKRPSQ